MEGRSEQVNVKVLFFGAARDAAGTDQATISTTFPATVAAIKAEVFSQFANTSRFSKSLMVAVNQSYASDETPVNDQDEIAFLPPVSGG